MLHADSAVFEQMIRDEIRIRGRGRRKEKDNRTKREREIESCDTEWYNMQSRGQAGSV